MRLLLVSVAMVTALVGVLALGASTEIAQAKGGVIAFTPEAGPVGEEFLVWSNAWPPDTEVSLAAGFSTERGVGYTRSADFIEPIATVRSDADGHWEATIQPDTITNLHIPNEPGYLFIRADSDGSYTTSHFVVTVDGQRPAGSGEIRLSLSLASGSSGSMGGFGWRKAGAPWFFSPYGMIPFPFETTIGSLEDGEWEIVAITRAGSEPIGEGTYDLGRASLCFNPSCAAGTPIVQVHSAFRVTVENGQIVEAKVVLGALPSDDSPTGQEPGVEPLVATVSPSKDGRTALIAGASALLAILAAGTVLVRYRRVAR